MPDDKKDRSDKYVFPLVRRKHTSEHDMPTRPYNEIPSMEEEPLTPATRRDTSTPSVRTSATSLNVHQQMIAPAIVEMDNGLFAVAHEEHAENKQAAMLATLIHSMNELERKPGSNVYENVFSDIRTLAQEHAVYALREMAKTLEDIAPAERRENAADEAEFSNMEKRLINEFRNTAKARAESLGVTKRVEIRLSELENTRIAERK